MTTRAPVREAIAACRDVEVVYGEGDAAVHVLGGLLEPSAGSVEWRGHPLSSLDRAARGAVRAKGIAYVFQGANLLPYFTALENIAFAAQLAEGGAAPSRLPA